MSSTPYGAMRCHPYRRPVVRGRAGTTFGVLTLIIAAVRVLGAIRTVVVITRLV